MIKEWRVEYNLRRPHSVLGHRPPVGATLSPWSEQIKSHRLRLLAGPGMYASITFAVVQELGQLITIR